MQCAIVTYTSCTVGIFWLAKRLCVQFDMWGQPEELGKFAIRLKCLQPITRFVIFVTLERAFYSLTINFFDTEIELPRRHVNKLSKVDLWSKYMGKFWNSFDTYPFRSAMLFSGYSLSQGRLMRSQGRVRNCVHSSDGMFHWTPKVKENPA